MSVNIEPTEDTPPVSSYYEDFYSLSCLPSAQSYAVLHASLARIRSRIETKKVRLGRLRDTLTEALEDVDDGEPELTLYD
jgi:hypothetical protein